MTTPTHKNPAVVFHAPSSTTGYKSFRGKRPGVEVLVQNVHKGTQELQWQFSAGWTTNASGREDHTSTAGASATLRFKGTRAIIYMAKDISHGQADIYVNGVIRTTIDCYYTSRIADIPVFDTGFIPDANHVIEVRATGTKNPSSTAATIAIDHAKVWSTGLTAPPATTTPEAGPVNLQVITDLNFTGMVDQIDYITTAKNSDATVPWYLSLNGSSPLNIAAGRLLKSTNTEDSHQMWHKTLIYGLKKTLRVEMVVTTDIGPSAVTSHAGLKIGPYYPAKGHLTPENPASVNDPGTAHLQVFTGQTARGRIEVHNQVWETAYRFSYENGVPSIEPGYENNTEQHIVVTFDFFSETRCRTRVWSNGGVGTPKFEWDDTKFAIGSQYPFFLRISTDDASWRAKSIKITLEDIVA